MSEVDFAVGAAMAKETLGYEALELIVEIMDEEGIRRPELARRMGVSLSYISAMLSGKLNMSLGFLAKALYALGYQVKLDVVDL